MSSLRSRLFVLLLSVFQFVLSVDAKGGGKGSSSKSSKQRPNSHSTSQTVVYRTNGYCYNEQHVLITCPYNKSTIIITIVLGAIAGLLLLAALITWYVSSRSRKKSKKSLDAEAKGAHGAPEGNNPNAPLVDEEIDEKDKGYSSDDESTVCDHSAEKMHKS